MIPIARHDDKTIGTCYHPSHDTPIQNMGGRVVVVSNNVQDEGKLVARIGDLAVSNCGHYGTIVTGKDDVASNERPNARMGDTTTGYYVARIVTASDKVFIS